ncbi:thiol:disulfide interchange protein DsbA/DsbL [Marinicella rhabdoformis]|uniref:thiol:disulfide interchange protein DsbA/DsbL n=1 Tax=Marinicella rhabdoformis TaxID=2580566 RepID=UPI0012AEC92E|nr:thiol:disulfide interchange protein DsbA/DsbL [Marinicella rhabdoformis]
MFKSLLIYLFLITATQPAHSNSEFQAGIHYQVMSPGITAEDNKSVIYEFFGYTCPGCYAMQPVMHELEDKAEFKLIRVPVVFHETWEPFAKTYHTLELMNLTEKTHAAIFNAIHVNKKALRNLEQIAEWLDASFDIDKQEFLSMSKSFAVDGKMRQAEKLRKSVNVTNTPTLIINGKYKPNNSKLGTKTNIIKASQELLKK